MTARRVEIVADEEVLAQSAAQRLIARIAANPSRPAICLTGGSSPQRLYALLAKPPWRERVPWADVHWFIGDDRFVPQGDPLSNIGAARRAFLDDCAPAENVHPIDTTAPTPEDAARRYEDTLRRFHGARPDAPLFDLVLMGVGPDGHTASLFPGWNAISETRRWVVGVPQAPVEPFVPRVTLTRPALASTAEMLFLASGADKRDILRRVFSRNDLPAAKVTAANGDTVWLIDRAASPDMRHGD